MSFLVNLAKAAKSRLPFGKPAYTFRGAVRDFKRRLPLWLEKRPAGPAKGRVGVVVVPWLDTAIPLSSVETALALRAQGWEPVFLCDFSEWAFNETSPSTQSVMKELCAELPKFGEVVFVASETSQAPPPFDVDLLLRENAVWTTKGEEFAEEFVQQRPELRAAFTTHASRVTAALKRVPVQWLLLPGGVFGVSGLYAGAASSMGIDFTTFDAGRGAMIVAHRGAAAHYADLPEAHRLLKAELEERPELMASIKAVVDELVLDRKESRDPLKLQAVAATGRTDLASDLLVFLNYRADTAALCRTRAFPSVRDWVTSLLDYAERRGDVRMIIRAHPVTRHTHVRSTDLLGELVRQRDPEGKFVRWIPGDAEVNSYDLINSTRVVLPFTSTVGIEAAFMDKPVIIGTHVFYESMGFVEAAGDATSYFALVERALRGELQPSAERTRQAALALYLALKCRVMRTCFTPIPVNFTEWVRMAPDELWGQPEQIDLRDALLTRQPLTWLRHQRVLKQSSRP